jgi:hypothetical protein
MVKCQNCKKHACFNVQGVRGAKYCKIHALNGMIDVVNIRCLHIGCNSRPSYNIIGNKCAIYCKVHALPEMVNVKHRHCLHPGCITIPNFNIAGRKDAKYCKTHALPNMVDIINKRCMHPGCNTQSSFNIIGSNTPMYCQSHALSGMVNVKHKTCAYFKCNIRPTYNTVGSKTPMYCKQHALPEMVNVVSKFCVNQGCYIRPTYNTVGSKIPMYCKQHALPEMVNVVSKFCVNQGCYIHPTYNSVGSKTPMYCKQHALPDMINVVSNVCINPGCNIRPNYNIIGSKKALYCKTHALAGMIDIKNKICKYPECTARILYGIPGKPPTNCAKHRETGMLQRPNGKCISCKAPAIYGIKLKPRHCETHKVDEDVNLTERECISCGLLYVLDKDNRCENCNPESFARAALAKQNALMTYLDVHGHPGTTLDDRIIDGGVCGKERPDRVIDLGDKIIVIECDENQHRERACSCEQARMVNIAQSFGGVPVYFIRWNPDNYKTEKKTETPLKQRYALLSELLTAIKTGVYIVPNGLVSVIYMFFDGWQGRPSMSESNWTTLLEFTKGTI